MIRPDRSVMQTPLPVEQPSDDEELYGLPPDPDNDPPDGAEAWLAGLPTPLLEEQFDDASSSLARLRVMAAGFLPRDRTGCAAGTGAGFGPGEVLDTMDAGPVLASMAAATWSGGLSQLADDELIGVLTAWRRVASWATAGELAAVAELTGRRRQQAGDGASLDLVRFLPDELATALTLTLRSANRLLDVATGLARLPRTRDALACGRIDYPKALVIIDELTGLDDAQAAAIEDAIIDAAAGQTTGQLRAALRRAVLHVDPAAADRRRKKAQQDTRVEVWTEASGTAALAGRDLPPADVLAADKRVDALARSLKETGADGTLDQLRAQVYIALLLGRPISVPSADSTGLAGSVNLTMPLASWLGAAQAPGEVAGFGPVDAGTCRTLGAALAARPGGRWCLTLTDAVGRAVGHGCARRAPAGSGWALHIKITDLATPACQHRTHPDTRQQPDRYRPSRRLRHLIEVRHRTCSFPGCRRAAQRCDMDHTIPHHLGGATCRCNLAPLCRRHHQAKQAQGWWLDQPEPGILVWTLPHGRRYRVEPDRYPAD
jgi:hypothetical protein